MSTFNLPDPGEGLEEGEIAAWHVAEGDHVVTDEEYAAGRAIASAEQRVRQAAGYRRWG